MCVTLSVLFRREAPQPLKGPDEVAMIVEANSLRDVADRAVRVFKEFKRCMNAGS